MAALARSSSQTFSIALGSAAGLLVLGSAGYLAIAGAHGPPLAVMMLGAVALAATVYLLVRAAVSLLSDPATDEETRVTGRRRKELEREKQALMKALKELEFDHEMKKISDGDFKDIAAGYRARAVRVMRLLDEGGTDYRKMIERDLAARAGTPQPAVKDRAPVAAVPVAPAPAAMHPIRPACPACATDNEPDAAFCKRCGSRISTERAS